MILNNCQFMGADLDPETAALYARQAAAAAGAGRAAEAASAAASARGQIQEQAQAAAVQHASAVASGSYQAPKWYAGKGLLFAGLAGGGLLLFLAMRSPSRPAAFYSRPRPRKS